MGAPFYVTEDDYLAGADAARFLFKKLEKAKGADKGKAKAVDKGKGKAEDMGKGKEADKGADGNASPRVKAEPVEARVGVKAEPVSPPRGRKRPRRSAAAVVRSYAVPDSDDEAIAAVEDREDEFAEFRGGVSKEKEKGKDKGVETVSALEEWVKALGELLKEEQHKVCPRSVLFGWCGADVCGA